MINTSTGMAFVLFVVIILYHAQRQARHTASSSKLMLKLMQLIHRYKKENVELQGVQLQCKLESPQHVTHSVVELIQPLLEKEEEKE